MQVFGYQCAAGAAWQLLVYLPALLTPHEGSQLHLLPSLLTSGTVGVVSSGTTMRLGAWHLVLQLVVSRVENVHT